MTQTPYYSLDRNDEGWLLIRDKRDGNDVVAMVCAKRGDLADKIVGWMNAEHEAAKWR